MENRINKVFTLENGLKYMVLHQAIYNDDNYFVCAPVTEDEQDLKEDFTLFHEIKSDNKTSVELVDDAKLAKFILEHLDLVD